MTKPHACAPCPVGAIARTLGIGESVLARRLQTLGDAGVLEGRPSPAATTTC